MADSPKLRWVSVHDKNTCRGQYANACWPRHNKWATLEQWERRGLPGSPILNCCAAGPRCRCVLAAYGAAGDIVHPVNAAKALERGRKRGKAEAQRIFLRRR